MILDRLSAFLAATEFSWLDVLDILIVALIIYELLQLIRGTHAVQMALGALVLVILYWASLWLNLQTLNWLLRTFLPFVVFGIIVVFQAEIRKVLAHLGKTPFFGAFSERRQEEVIDEVVLATTTLAAQKTGALLVIEREMGLRSYIETGIALDALVTYDLLISIFNPGTPLHDGAVILQGNRVAAAASFLPLTVNPELSRALGSRHRAAIGVTEDTDALAVVVSEETGTISLVQGGRSSGTSTGLRSSMALLTALNVAEAREARPAAAPAAGARPQVMRGALRQPGPQGHQPGAGRPHLVRDRGREDLGARALGARGAAEPSQGPRAHGRRGDERGGAAARLARDHPRPRSRETSRR